MKTLLLSACLFWASALAWAGPRKGYPCVDYNTGLAAARTSGKPVF
ncbi:MAG: hypothetical protein LDL16_08040 [Thiobacillus sp.]|nr:hypothetical protein [Thiobacillus sp.]